MQGRFVIEVTICYLLIIQRIRQQYSIWFEVTFLPALKHVSILRLMIHLKKANRHKGRFAYGKVSGKTSINGGNAKLNRSTVKIANCVPAVLNKTNQIVLTIVIALFEKYLCRRMKKTQGAYSICLIVFPCIFATTRVKWTRALQWWIQFAWCMCD